MFMASWTWNEGWEGLENCFDVHAIERNKIESFSALNELCKHRGKHITIAIPILS